MTKASFRLLLFVLASLWSIATSAQEKKIITGVIKDSAGIIMPGVTVSEKGTTTTAISDMDGKFRIPVSSARPVLVFTSIGFERKEVPVGDQTVLNISMQAQGAVLEDVVVTALGIKREQRKLGYATTQIAAKDIIQTAPTNFASALYGKAPGVAITTNPGGATSAVGVQIRGINSLSYQRQPLMVVDGVVIRNGDANSEGYWGGNQRLNGNGLLDINPENIESINILKGAAASALYGSDANFGVIVITTKNGKGGRKGLGVEFNLSGNIEKVAVTPDLQTTYGPGYDTATNKINFGSDGDGWIHMNVNGQDVVRPIFRAYAQFGPKVDGRPVYWWDGQMREYKSQPDNWKEFYRTGHSTIANIALNNSSDKMNYRFSYTRNDYKGIQIGGKQEKNTFNFNSTYKITPKLSLDLIVNYINEKVHNRPRQLFYVTNNFSGFFSPVDYMDLYFQKYQTSKGYKWVDYNQNYDVDERLKYRIRATDFLDFLWNQLANSYDETTNRFITSATLNYNIAKGLNVRGRFGSDYTGYFAETKNRTERPITYGATGAYGTNTNRFTYTYGDVLLSYDRDLVKDLHMTVSAGYQARKEDYRYNSVFTRDGLTTENWFSFNASKTTPVEGGPLNNSNVPSKRVLVKDGLFGILAFDYHNYLFVEATLRRERSSTLHPDNNTFYYPAVSGAFELNNAFALPNFVTYSKLRAAYGVVGNPPDPYKSNVVYNSNNAQGIPVLYPPISSYGNPNLRNEKKHEFEVGWENKFLSNRVGFDITYYNSKVIDQILDLSTPATIGSRSVVVNVGDMRNYGVELGLYGTPFRTKNWSWDTRLNLSFNRNKVLSLMPGLERLQLGNVDNGSLLVVAEPGKMSGEILAYKRRQDDKGNYIINSDGYYDVNFDERASVGNLQPKATGGLINTVNYKNFSLNFLVDFRFGGQVISTPLYYGLGSGMYESTLWGRDTEHGGLSYYIETGSGKVIPVPAGTAAGPKNEKVRNDGIMLKGVTADGKENTKIIDAADYYLVTHDWAADPGESTVYEFAVFDNDFIKLREVSLTYMLPRSISGKLKVQNLSVSLFGRNLFYFHKTLPNLDPEEGVGTNWVSQGTSFGTGNAATRSLGASIRVTF